MDDKKVFIDKKITACSIDAKAHSQSVFENMTSGPCCKKSDFSFNAAIASGVPNLVTLK